MEAVITLLASVLGLFGFGAEVASAQTPDTPESVELGIVELSPRGHEGGYAMPASNDSSPIARCEVAINYSGGNVRHPGPSITVVEGESVRFSTWYWFYQGRGVQPLTSDYVINGTPLYTNLSYATWVDIDVSILVHRPIIS